MKPFGASGSGAGFHNGFGNVFRSAESAANKDAGTRCLDGILESCFAKSVFFQFDTEAGRQFNGILGRH